MTTPFSIADAESRAEHYQVLRDVLALLSVAEHVFERQGSQVQIARDLVNLRKRMSAIVEGMGRRVDL